MHICCYIYKPFHFLSLHFSKLRISPKFKNQLSTILEDLKATYQDGKTNLIDVFSPFVLHAFK